MFSILSVCLGILCKEGPRGPQKFCFSSCKKVLLINTRIVLFLTRLHLCIVVCAEGIQILLQNLLSTAIANLMFPQPVSH